MSRSWPILSSSINFSAYGKKLLADCLQIEMPKIYKISVDEIIKKSSQFPIAVSIISEERVRESF